MTLARIYMNHESAIGYERVFRHFFNLIELRIGRPLRWQTIHGNGIKAISMDMDTKQYPGKVLSQTYYEDLGKMLLTSLQQSDVLSLQSILNNDLGAGI